MAACWRYARYRYYRGDIHPLMHKAFFQVEGKGKEELRYPALRVAR